MGGEYRLWYCHYCGIQHNGYLTLKCIGCQHECCQQCISEPGLWSYSSSSINSGPRPVQVHPAPTAAGLRATPLYAAPDEEIEVEKHSDDFPSAEQQFSPSLVFPDNICSDTATFLLLDPNFRTGLSESYAIFYDEWETLRDILTKMIKEYMLKLQSEFSDAEIVLSILAVIWLYSEQISHYILLYYRSWRGRFTKVLTAFEEAGIRTKPIPSLIEDWSLTTMQT